MAVKLTVEHQTFCFDADAIGIGRDPGNQVALLNDDRLAPQHAELRKVNDRWIIESREGGPFRVGNGRPARFSWLKSGDVICLTETGPEVAFEIPSVDSSGFINLADLPNPPLATVNGASNSPPARDRYFVPAIKEKRAKPAKAISPDSRQAVIPKKTVDGQSVSSTMTMIILGASSLMIVAVACWAFVSLRSQNTNPERVVQEQNQATRENTSDDPMPPPRIVLRPGSETISVDPREFLVLIGFGNLKSDDRPHVLGVGWLWNERTAVTSRAIGDAIKEIVNSTLSEGDPRQGCAIQGLVLEISEVNQPPECEQISILRLKESAELSAAAFEQWKKTNSLGIERHRALGKRLKYFSYEPLPRPKSVTGKHSFPLCEYDPETCRSNQEEIRLEYQQPDHFIKSLNLERGGLIFDEDQKIVGMAPSNSPIVWTETLERVLANH